MDFNSDDFRDQLEAILFKIKTGFTQVIRLLGYGLLCGTIVGAVASVFALGIDYATELRAQHPWVIFLMPIGAAVIVFFYQKFDHSEGTDTVLLAITRNECGYDHNSDGQQIPLWKYNLIKWWRGTAKEEDTQTQELAKDVEEIEKQVYKVEPHIKKIVGEGWKN